MRILEIINRKRKHGGEDVAADMIAEALSSRHQIERCIFDLKGWTEPSAIPAWKQALLMWNNPSSLARISDLTTKMKPDFLLIHGVIPVGSLGIYRFAAEHKIPVIQFCHNFRPFSVNAYLWANDRIEPAGLKGNFWPEILAGSWQNSRKKTLCLGAMYWIAHKRHQFDNIAHWIAISDFIRNRFLEAKIPPHKISALKHFHNFTNLNAQECKQGKHFLFLGRLSIEKGIQVLLAAWEYLADQLGSECPKLVIAGNGPLEAEIRHATEKNPHITWCGYVSGEEKNQLLRDSTAIIAPSLCWEALGIINYEAFDFLKPVLAAASGGMPEIIEDGISGFLHAPGDYKQLATQVLQLHENPSMGWEMGQAGHRWLQQNASVSLWLEKFQKIVENALTLYRKTLAESSIKR